MFSLIPEVCDFEVPLVVPSVSLVPVVQLSETRPRFAIAMCRGSCPQTAPGSSRSNRLLFEKQKWLSLFDRSVIVRQLFLKP